MEMQYDCDKEKAVVYLEYLERKYTEWLTHPKKKDRSVIEDEIRTVADLWDDTIYIALNHGYSVLDMVKAFIKESNVDIPYSIKSRRAGDIATCYCNPAKAKAELGWEAKFGIDEMVRDSWNWQRQNPNGYSEK